MKCKSLFKLLNQELLAVDDTIDEKERKGKDLTGLLGYRKALVNIISLLEEE